MSIIFYTWTFFLHLGYFSKDTAESGIGKYSKKIRFNNLSGNHEPNSLEALLELKEEKGVMETSGYFFLGEINVTMSEFCFPHHNNKCPPKTDTERKNCYEHNIPCKYFKYDTRNSKLN